MSEVVVITGASSGLGRAIAKAFAQRGAKIGLLARSTESLEGARRSVIEAGGQALIIPTDVANAAQVEAAAAVVEDTFGPIDVWINNAMVTVLSEVKDMTPEEFERVTDVCYHGYVYGTMSALKRMLPRDQGHIIQVGSALSYRAIPLQSAYCGAKHAIEGFTDSLRTELIYHHSMVRVTTIQMPGMDTPQFLWCKSRLPMVSQPVPPIYDPELCARAVVYAVDHPRREIWVGVINAIGMFGHKVAPGLADWIIAQIAYDGQQSDIPDDPDRPHNLWEPVPGDRGLRGNLGDKSIHVEPYFELVVKRRIVPVFGALLGALALLIGLRRRA